MKCLYIFTKGQKKGKACEKLNCKNHNKKVDNLDNNLDSQKKKDYHHNYLKIPFDKNFSLNLEDIYNVKIELDKYIYKMENVKNELENYLYKRISNPNSNRNILGLYGSQGVGKTKIIKSISKILNYPIYTIPLGGIKDSSYLLGHNYTYVESSFGEIVKALIKTQIMNPIIYFDELDKVSESVNGKEIYSLLTFLTDPSQNNVFKDHYFSNVEIDLSKVFFIFTFNDITKIDKVLLDRINLIKTKDYTDKEKMIILSEYTIDDIIKNINPKINIKLSKNCYEWIISEFSSQNLSLREYIFIFEKILMEYNKELLKNYFDKKRKSANDFDDNDENDYYVDKKKFIELFNIIKDSINVKTKETYHHMYL